MKSIKMLILWSCTLTIATVAHAQTWVSNVGNDANACSIGAPCKTFQRAVSVTPSFGQVRVLNAGDYGPVVLNQSIQIDGGGLASITVTGSTVAVLANAPAGGVIQLRNLSIHGYAGASQGIHDQGAGGLDIDNVHVTGFAGDCVEASSVSGPIDLVIKDTTIENCSSNGINISGSASYPSTAKIINTHVRFANGGLVTNYGVTVSVFSSTFSSPGPPTASTGTVGIDGGTGTLLLDDCQVSGYGNGVIAYGGKVQISRSSFIDNWVALLAEDGGTLVTNENNSFVGNNSIGTPTSKVALQ